MPTGQVPPQAPPRPPPPEAGRSRGAPLKAADRQPDQRRIVADLADASRVPVEEVAELYAHAHAALAVGAHITKYLHIFAIRNVQETLRKRAFDQRALQAANLPLQLASERGRQKLSPR